MTPGAWLNTSTPFVVATVGLLAILVAFPEISLTLPRLLKL